MAIIRSAALPRVRKKIGDLVFKHRLGQTIVSQRQLIVKNPRTLLQRNQRGRFKMAIIIALQFKYFMEYIFPKATYKGTKMNKVVQFYLKKIVEPAFPMVSPILFNGQAIGNGSAFPVVPLTFTAHAGKQVSATWNPDDIPPDAPDTGIVGCLGISMTRGVVGFDPGSFPISGGATTFFGTSSPFIAGEVCIFALVQNYTDPVTGLSEYSKATYENAVSKVTMFA